MTKKGKTEKAKKEAFINTLAKAPPQTAAQQTAKLTQQSLETLPWKDNKYGQYIFRHTQDGQITPGAGLLLKELKAAGGKIKNLYGRDYRISGEGIFINRSRKK